MAGKQHVLRVTAGGLLVGASVMLFMSRSVAQQSIGAPKEIREKPVEQVFKNIKVLTSMPQSQFFPAMVFIATSMGKQCEFCHVSRNGRLDFSADDKPEKQTARGMITMVQEINKRYLQDNPQVSCYTCHRGSASPRGFPTLPLPVPAPQSQIDVSASTIINPSSPGLANTNRDLPTVEAVLNKFSEAIGGKSPSIKIESAAFRGTSETWTGKPTAYETVQVLPDKGYESYVTESGTSERIMNGSRGWLRNADGIQDLVGQQLLDQKLSFPLFMILDLKDQYASLRVSARETIDGREMYIVSANRTDDKRERLYFEAQSGLLRRRISYLITLIGTIPQQADFEDYRIVSGLKLPYKITVSNTDARSPIIIRKFTEIDLNVHVAESRFNKPQ